MKYTKGGFPYKTDLTKKPVGPTAEKKNAYDEKEEQIIENMSNAKDNNFDGHMEINKIKQSKDDPGSKYDPSKDKE